ncbi:MAG: type II toxin-antitoxin system HicA family toxin [Patescibacteria group bacterium]|nr:type II toxin-antitoxin system HicA family toxin [Patescibacteria group bacterium]
MKRHQLLKYLNKFRCFLFREGTKHSIYYNPENDRTSAIPRHSEIDDWLANKICKDLGIKQIKK